MSTISRRSLLRVAGLSGMAATIGGTAACTTGDPNDVTWSMWSSSAAEGKVWSDFGDFVQKAMHRRSVSQLTPSDGYSTKMDLQLVSGTAPMVTAVNGTLISTYAARGALQPLDDLIGGDPDFDADDFFPASRRISSFAGRTYAIGFDVAPTVLYYNKTMFAAAGIKPPSPTEPMSWQQFRELAVEFARKDGQYGFSCAPSIDDLVSWLYCAGGNVMNEQQSVSTLHTDASLHALRFVIDLFTRDRVTPPIDSLVTTSALSNFLDGNVAMMQNGPWQVVNARKADFEWDIVPFPAGPAGSTPRVSGSSFAMPSGTKDVELGWQLLKTLTSTAALDIYARAGRNNPARESASTAFAAPPANVGIVQEILAGRLAGGHPYDVTTNWNEVRDLLGQDLPRCFLGQRAVDDVIKGLRPRLDSLMVQNQDNIRQLEGR